MSRHWLKSVPSPMSLRKRIQVLLAFLVAVPLVILFAETYRHGHQALVSEMKRGSLEMATLEAAEMDLAFLPARQAAEGVARAVEALPTLDPETVRNLLRGTLEHVPDAYGFCVALLPDATPAGALAPYAFRLRGQVQERSLASGAYQYTRWDWFRLPLVAGRGQWTEPYFDRGGGDALMVTYGTPIHRDGRLVGVATVDLSLASLAQRLGRLHPGGDGTVYLVGRTGRILLHPRLRPMAEPGAEDPQALARLRTLLEHRGTDTVEMKDPVARRRSWLVEMPVPTMASGAGGRDWSLIVSWPMAPRMTPLLRLALRMGLLFLFLGGGALLFLHRAFEDSITRPLRRLVDQARGFAQGDCAIRRAPREESEDLQELGQAIRTLGEALAEARGTGAGRDGGRS
jgi:sigma-B regulation protein RsbU (phosphoserine phosphatase)